MKCILIWLNQKASRWELGKKVHLSNSRQSKRFKNKFIPLLLWTYWYRFQVATGIGWLVNNVKWKMGFRSGRLDTPNLTSCWLLFLCEFHLLPFLHALGCLAIVSLTRWNRLSLLSHYRVAKGSGFGWTYPTSIRLCINSGTTNWLSSALVFWCLPSADLDLSLNILWTVETYLLPTKAKYFYPGLTPACRAFSIVTGLIVKIVEYIFYYEFT